MTTWPLEPEALASIARLVLELETLADDGNLISVEADARLPIAGGPKTRRVDMAARFSADGEDRLRILEMPRRGRQVDQDVLDRVETKLKETGATKAAILSDSGYAHDIMNRLERSKTVAGVQYTKPNVAQWPVDENGILATIARTEAKPEALILRPAATIRRIGASEPQLVLLGTSETSNAVIGALVPRTPDAGGRFHVSLWILAGEEPFKSGEASVHVTLPDGRSPLVVTPGRRPSGLIVPKSVRGD